MSHEQVKNDGIVTTTKEHIRGHLWHRHSITVNQVMILIV